MEKITEKNLQKIIEKPYRSTKKTNVRLSNEIDPSGENYINERAFHDFEIWFRTRYMGDHLYRLDYLPGGGGGLWCRSVNQGPGCLDVNQVGNIEGGGFCNLGPK